MLATETPQASSERRKVRLSMFIDRGLHRRLRFEALETEVSMREYVESILERRHELVEAAEATEK